MKIEVKGHSGCQIDIVNDGNKLYIKKCTYDPKYVPRLAAQAQKQLDASQNIYQHIRIPKIFNIDQTKNHLIIKMEYVYSKNFVDYFEDAGFDNINYFVQALKIFVDSEIKNSPIQKVDSDIVKTKFLNVCETCKQNVFVRNDAETDVLLKSCGAVFSGLPRYIEMPIGQCHGDLTFSNILFNGNNYYLIDFLDSFIESPLLDLVKIRQDSKYEWSRLMYERELDLVRLGIISQKIDKEIDSYYKKYKWYRELLFPFQLMNFLRILQYAKEDKVICYLKNVLKSML